jgi:uncharacterized membrane protein YkgB
MNLKPNVSTGLQFQRVGGYIIRYGLSIVLIWIGILKFTSYESEGIQPLIAHSPLLSWGYSFLSVAAYAGIIGIIEILSGILIAIYAVAPKLSLIGSYAGIATFVITLSFMFSTPGVIQMGYGFPFISPQPAQFLLKDIVLLGASVWTAGEALTRFKISPDLIES